MFFPKTAAAVLALVPLAVATACTESNAIDWPYISGGDDACANYCGNDSACLQACYAEAEQGQCNAVGCSDKRSTLDCASDETCFRYTDGALLCLNAATGEYVDDIGGHGNAGTGVYTWPDGSVTTNLGDSATTTTARAATATDAGQSTRSTSAASVTATASGTSSSGGSRTTLTITSSGASKTTSTTAASPTATSGVEGRRIEVWAIGASGLFAVFIRNIMY
ncbi:hypothetical protein GGS24DRAFT_444933 [Hypoxylon argillaceum]|nr:hypothetical protein GGS24DRAFT_444933 [Hypoxylon argillaceum]